MNLIIILMINYLTVFSIHFISFIIIIKNLIYLIMIDSLFIKIITIKSIFILVILVFNTINFIFKCSIFLINYPYFIFYFKIISFIHLIIIIS